MMPFTTDAICMSDQLILCYNDTQLFFNVHNNTNYYHSTAVISNNNGEFKYGTQFLRHTGKNVHESFCI